MSCRSLFDPEEQGKLSRKHKNKTEVSVLEIQKMTTKVIRNHSLHKWEIELRIWP